MNKFKYFLERNFIMELKDLMNTSPETLAKKQYEELKSHTLNVFNRIIQLILGDNLNSIEEFLFDSPAGDDYGLDNRCINFSYNNKVMDIGDILDQLNNLKKIMNK
jgi:hypothetical protein